MYLNVRVQGRTCRALLDGGATSCFIDPDLVQTMGLRTVSMPPMDVALGKKGVVASTDQAVVMELRLAKGVRYTATLYVMPLGPAPVILGQPFYRDLHLLVNYGPAREVTFVNLPNGRPPVTIPVLPPPSPRPAVAHLATLSEREMKKELRRATQAGTPASLALIQLRVSAVTILN